MAVNDSTDDSHKFERQELTPVDEERRYIVNFPQVNVTIDHYTPFQAHIIRLLTSIDSRLGRIGDRLGCRGQYGGEAAMSREEFIEKWCESGELEIRFGVVLEDSEFGYITPRRWWEFYKSRTPVFQKGQVIVVEWNDGIPLTVGVQSKPGKVGANVEYFTDLYDALNRSYEIVPLMTAEEYKDWKDTRDNH